MNRYSNIEIDKRFDGKRVYKSTIYPNIPEDVSDTYIVTNDTMYLDTIAYKYYKDVSLWWVIALANKIGKGRLSVPAGIQLRIPGNIIKILNDYKLINS
jgi:nucleoid-associated protein YgaU